MPRFVNPARIAAPASRYSHGVVHGARARRLVVSGQVGLRPDGALVEGLEGQLDAALDNLFAVLTEAGMGVGELVKLTAYCTVPGGAATWRRVRERRLGGHAPAATYLEVAGLASPGWLIEVDAEAVMEEGDFLMEELPAELRVSRV